MDLVLLKYYADKMWNCGETYESLIWKDTTTEKPTEEELNIKWAEIKIEQMREKRNELFKECDFRFVSDYPFSSEEQKEEWKKYRQSLRDLPSIWVEGMEYPKKPE